jgi:hypothetical protein
MTRFFFHVTNGNAFKDEVGQDYSLESARAHAAQIATDLAKEPSYEGFAVVVTDEHGNEVAYALVGAAANRGARGRRHGREVYSGLDH